MIEEDANRAIPVECAPRRSDVPSSHELVAAEVEKALAVIGGK